MSSIETLVCTANAAAPHDFTRERKRGVKPSICPDCKAERETAHAEAVAERAEAVHLIGGIITVAAVRAIQNYRDWLKADRKFFAGEITDRPVMPDLSKLPADDVWRAATAANLI